MILRNRYGVMDVLADPKRGTSEKNMILRPAEHAE
jgi:hypothetical protein